MTATRIPPGLYGLADSSFGNPFALAEALHSAGCNLIQIRAKDWPAEALISEGRTTLARLTRKGAVVIINDHIEVARALGASGVHLGQSDCPPSEARTHLGDQAIIGLSTHNLDQVRSAQEVDYLGFGPIFETRTKQQAGQPRGVELLRQAVCATSLPVIAIGGIHVESLSDVRKTGVHGWAVASALFISTPLDVRAYR